MTIAVDTRSEAAGVAYATGGKAWTHTVTAGGNDRILIVAIQVYCDSSQTISSVTYAGVALNKTDNAASDMTSTNGVAVRCELWKLVAPPTGSAEIVVLPSATARITAQASSWTGVHQTTPVGAKATGSSTGTTFTSSPAAGAGDIAIDSAGKAGSALTGDLTVGASQTVVNVIESYLLAGGSSYESYVATSPIPMTWTYGASMAWASVSVALKPSTTTSDPVSATVKIAEVRVTPLRAAPAGFSPTGVIAENNQAGYEATGQFPKLLVGRVVGDTIIWDDVITLPSVAPGARIMATSIPTANSSSGSLIVTTQDSIYQYPLPYGADPSTSREPNLARAGLTDLIPVFYPSGVDLGGPHELRYLEVIGQNWSEETDSWGVSVRMDDTNPWETVKRASEAEAVFDFEGVAGRTLWTAVSINDGAATDPVGPAGREIGAWLKPLDEAPAQPARNTNEVS